MRRLLPVRTTVASRAIERQPRNYLVELFVPADSPVAGRPARQLDVLRSGAVRLLDVIRGDLSLRHSLDEVRLEAGDRIVLRCREEAVMGLRAGAPGGLLPIGPEPTSTRKSVVVEVLIGPNARVLGRTFERLRWHRRYGVYPIALHREGANLQERLESVPLAVGDTVLIDGAPEDILRLADDARLTNLSTVTARAFRHDKAPIAIGALLAWSCCRRSALHRSFPSP